MSSGMELNINSITILIDDCYDVYNVNKNVIFGISMKMFFLHFNGRSPILLGQMPERYYSHDIRRYIF